MPALGAVPIPGLVVFRTGRLSGAAPLHVFGDAMNVQEDQVDKWLQSKLLGGSATLTAGSQSDEEAEDSEKPCSLCGRCYQHEHIRSLYQRPHEPDSQDSDDSS